MLHNKFKLAYIFSGIIAILATIESLGGLFLDNLFRDNIYVSSQLRGNDLVTLVLGVPLLIGGMVFSRRGLIMGQLVWLGTLWYMFYNYVF